MAYDFKKEYREFYMPPKKPTIVTVPQMNYIAVSGEGDPNAEDGEYKRAMNILYSVAFTLRMSAKSGHDIEGFFDYVVPPLEGFWRQDGGEFDYAHKENFKWTSVIRLPDFITKAEFDWAVQTAGEKKKIDTGKARFLTVDEGTCVQIMHIGPYDDEPKSVALMEDFARQNGYETDICESRQHHEIYLSDPRRTAPEKLKTVIRHPIKKSV